MPGRKPAGVQPQYSQVVAGQTEAEVNVQHEAELEVNVPPGSDET